jgi:hypothetical protein
MEATLPQPEESEHLPPIFATDDEISLHDVGVPVHGFKVKKLKVKKFSRRKKREE